MQKVAITGTKGKTTISNVLAAVLQQVNPEPVLRVDTTGAYLNGELKVSKTKSQQIWNQVPTVAPGRFLYLLDQAHPFEDGLLHSEVPGIAVLESSLGSGTLSGQGYYSHDVGVFTNVFEDHLGSRPDLKTRMDIGNSKKFIFSRLDRDNGVAVFNADDDVVTHYLPECPEKARLLPFGLTFTHFDVKKHLANGGAALTVRDGDLILMKGLYEQVLLKVADVSWTFRGQFPPSIYNLMAVAGALLGLNNLQIDKALMKALQDSKLDPYGGRLTMLESATGVHVLADYAHEKQSLASVAQLAHRLVDTPQNKVIGVLRLTWDREVGLIEDTADFIANEYDHFIIYDKIDGYWRHPSTIMPRNIAFKQEVGKISRILADRLLQHRGEDAVECILREDEAVARAVQVAKPGDVIVFIVNDNIKRSLDFISKELKITP